MCVFQVDLQLLKLPDVGVTLQLQVSHLVLVFLELVEPFVLLSLLLLHCKLHHRDAQGQTSAQNLWLHFHLCHNLYLFDLLPLLLRGDDSTGDS